MLLGYANPTTLSQMRRGTTFPDVERLATLGKMDVARKASPNLHWILTGVGSPFVPLDPSNAVAQSAASALSKVALLAYEESKRLRARHPRA